MSRLTNNQLTQLGEKLFSSCFLSNTVDSSQCFCFPLEKDGAIVFVPVLTRSEFADFYNARVNGTLHCSAPLNTRHQHQAAFACLIFNIFFCLSIISVLWTVCPCLSQNYPNSVLFSALIRTFESNETATLKNSINPVILSEKSFFEENNTAQIK